MNGLTTLWTHSVTGRCLGDLSGLNAKGRRLRKNRTGREGLFFGFPTLTDGKRSLVVTGHVQRLGRESEIDSFGVEAFHDLDVDPLGVLQIVPVLGRVVPVSR